MQNAVLYTHPYVIGLPQIHQAGVLAFPSHRPEEWRENIKKEIFPLWLHCTEQTTEDTSVFWVAVALKLNQPQWWIENKNNSKAMCQPQTKQWALCITSPRFKSCRFTSMCWTQLQHLEAFWHRQCLTNHYSSMKMLMNWNVEYIHSVKPEIFLDIHFCTLWPYSLFSFVETVSHDPIVVSLKLSIWNHVVFKSGLMI